MVSDADRARMASLARDLAAVETDEPASDDALGRAVAAANAHRARHGLPPLAQDEAFPEENLYIRARALGLRRIRR
jgi:hypothetical protein